jgi:hypothetical protein
MTPQPPASSFQAWFWRADVAWSPMPQAASGAPLRSNSRAEVPALRSAIAVTTTSRQRHDSSPRSAPRVAKPFRCGFRRTARASSNRSLATSPTDGAGWTSWSIWARAQQRRRRRPHQLGRHSPAQQCPGRVWPSWPPTASHSAAFIWPRRGPSRMSPRPPAPCSSRVCATRASPRPARAGSRRFTRRSAAGA